VGELGDISEDSQEEDLVSDAKPRASGANLVIEFLENKFTIAQSLFNAHDNDEKEQYRLRHAQEELAKVNVMAELWGLAPDARFLWLYPLHLVVRSLESLRIISPPRVSLILLLGQRRSNGCHP
jgi:hypothetical protein